MRQSEHLLVFFCFAFGLFCPLRRVHLFVTHYLLSPFPFIIYGHLLACLWGVFRKFLKISSTYIGKFSSLCGGISLNIFKNTSTIIGNLRHESWRSVWNFFLTEGNLLTIYGQQRVRTSYFSEKKYPSTIIGNFRHES